MYWAPSDGVKEYKVTILDETTGEKIVNNESIPADKTEYLFSVKGGHNYKISVGSFVTEDNQAWSDYEIKGDRIISRELLKGRAGDDVRVLQEKLNYLWLDTAGYDYRFGDVTTAAVKALQEYTGNNVDGKVGNDTWHSINELMKQRNEWVQQAIKDGTYIDGKPVNEEDRVRKAKFEELWGKYYKEIKDKEKALEDVKRIEEEAAKRLGKTRETLISPIWNKNDEKYSMMVQAKILQHNLDWYFAESQAQRDELVKKANDLRAGVSKGFGAFINSSKSITEAATEELSFLESVSKYERDELLQLNQIFQPSLVINQTQNQKDLRTTIFLMGLIGAGEERFVVKGVKSLIKENGTLVKIAKNFDSGNKLTNELNELIPKFLMGNKNPGAGTKHLFNGIYELRTDNGARLYYRLKDGHMEILAKSDKKTQNQVIEILKKIYGN